MYAGNSLDRPSVYLKCWYRYEPSVPVLIETLSAGSGKSPLNRWRYEPSVPVETPVPVAVRSLCAGRNPSAGGGTTPLCRWRYEPSVPVAVRALCAGRNPSAGGGTSPLCRWRYEPSVPVAVGTFSGGTGMEWRCRYGGV